MMSSSVLSVRKVEVIEPRWCVASLDLFAAKRFDALRRDGSLTRIHYGIVYGCPYIGGVGK
jgi:hypothetical protein